MIFSNVLIQYVCSRKSYFEKELVKSIAVGMY